MLFVLLGFVCWYGGCKLALQVCADHYCWFSCRPQYSKKSISSCYQLGEIIGVGGETRLLAGVASTISCVFFKGPSVTR